MNDTMYSKAFSIAEGVVTLVVSAILVGITFVIFTMIFERMNDFKNQNQFVNDLNRLTYSVNKDIFECSTIVLQESELVFYKYSGEKISYLQQEDYLVRQKENFIDTFIVAASRLHLDTLYSADKKVVYQRLAIDIKDADRVYDLKFFRKIDARMLLNTLKDHEF
jgi:hypothetical protein